MKWVRRTAVILGSVAVVYGMVYLDLLMRARHAYLEGEKYWSWHRHPEEKVKYYEQWLAQRRGELEKKLRKGKISSEVLRREKELLEFQKEEALRESSIKYAYVWYQTAVELFSPPDSKWVRLSRERMLLAKELWRKELQAKKIPFEEYMLE